MQTPLHSRADKTHHSSFQILMFCCFTFSRKKLVSFDIEDHFSFWKRIRNPVYTVHSHCWSRLISRDMTAQSATITLIASIMIAYANDSTQKIRQVCREYSSMIVFFATIWKFLDQIVYWKLKSSCLNIYFSIVGIYPQHISKSIKESWLHLR